MKKAVMRITRPLSRVPVELGEKLAWWLFLAMMGFIGGWIASDARWVGFMCFTGGI